MTEKMTEEEMENFERLMNDGFKSIGRPDLRFKRALDFEKMEKLYKAGKFDKVAVESEYLCDGELKREEIEDIMTCGDYIMTTIIDGRRVPLITEKKLKRLIKKFKKEKSKKST